MISVVIPTLNDEAALQQTMAPLVRAAMDGLVREVVVADGGSTDKTLALAEDAGAVIVASEKGRAGQLAAGCKATKGQWLLILYPGMELQDGWMNAVANHMSRHPTKAARLSRRGVFGMFSSGEPRVMLLPRQLYEAVGLRARPRRLRAMIATGPAGSR